MILHCLLFPSLAGALLWAAAALAEPASTPDTTALRLLQKRWLFVWRDLSNPQEVDRMIARFPAARATGYNGVAKLGPQPGAAGRVRVAR